MRGRKPKPTHIKAITGNPGKRPLNVNEMRPEPEIPECPPELSDAAKAEWERLTKELGQFRIITALDRAALASYCSAYGMWLEATQAIRAHGLMVKSPNGFPVQSPYVSIANRQAEIMMRYASEFGFTPASRGRITAPKENEADLFSSP